MFKKVILFLILTNFMLVSTEELTTVQPNFEKNLNLENNIYKLNLDKETINVLSEETNKNLNEDNEKQIIFQTQSSLNNDDEIKKIDSIIQNNLSSVKEEISEVNSEIKTSVDKIKNNLEDSKNDESNSINEPIKENLNTELPINIDSSSVFEIQTNSPSNPIENKEYVEENFIKNNEKNKVFVYSNIPNKEGSIDLNINDNSNWNYPIIKYIPRESNKNIKSILKEEIELEKIEKKVNSEEIIEKSKIVDQKDYIEMTTTYPVIQRYRRGIADVLFPNGVGHEIGHFRDHIVDYVGKRLTAVSSQRIYVHHKYHHEPNHLAKLPLIGPYLDENKKKKPTRTYRVIQ